MWDFIKNNLNEIALLLIGTGMFSCYFPKRQKFVLRIVISTVVSVCIALCLSLIMYYSDSGGIDAFVLATRINYIVLLTVAIVYACICFKIGVFEGIMVGMCAYATENITSQLKNFVSLFDITSSVLENLLTMIIILITYLLVYFLLARKLKKGIVNPNKAVLLINLFCLIVSCIILPTSFFTWNSSAVDNDLLNISNNTVSFISLSFDLLTIAVEITIVERNRVVIESNNLQQMLDKSKKQYELSKDMIAMVNRKYHDMKHYINACGEGVDRQIAAETEEAVRLYDLLYNTGNKALDVVISEKAIKCNENNISFSCMADGKLLDFMKQTDIYSIFGNALDNAIENVINYPVEQRVISVNVSSHSMMTKVHFENYCAKSPVFRNGLPVTSKKDVYNHGYGVESIQYITNQYGGNFSVRYRDCLFEIDLLFYPSFNLCLKNDER